ncbi:MAG: ABC transporter ATP-binding protein [Treponema sp.]|nr:ABC transporter ATP-binding protein [Treponema sp.]
MSFIAFTNVHYSYPAVEGDIDENGNQIQPPVIFDHFNAELPGGFTSLVGPNGSGKSTFMLLAGGRILPLEGKVYLCGNDTAALTPEQRDLLASYIYQNMELETEEKVGDLLNYVYTNGVLKGKAKAIRNKDQDLLEEIKTVFELEKLTDKKLSNTSKGEHQRVLLAFSLLYGSESTFMDEPMFAMEEGQKQKALEYLKDFCAATETTIYISMHELDYTKKYAQNVMLFYPNHDIDFGTPEEVLTDEALEKAYGLPVAMLKHSESLTRSQLTEESDVLHS